MGRTNPPEHEFTTKIDRNLWGGQGEEIRIDNAALHEHLRRAETLAQLDNLGLGMLSIQEAAELIACDMWASGEIEVEALDDFSGSLLAPEVKAALTDVISAFVTRLTNAIEIGRLKSEHIRRDFDENIIPTETFIGSQPLEEWLNARGYYFGDAFAAWQDEENSIADRVVDEVIWLRSVKGKTKGDGLLVGLAINPGFVDESSRSELLGAYKSAVLENQHLRERLASAESRSMVKAEPPPSPRHRRTLLTLIAALLELLKAPAGLPRQGMNQAAIKSAILERFPWPGLSERNLETIFADANKAKVSAE